jgi:hypothetical protein
MSEFSLDYSRINEGYGFLLSKDVLQGIRAHARIVLTPFFQRLAIRALETETGKKYPALTQLAESIIESVFNCGHLSPASEDEANNMALEFIRRLNTWQKVCLAYYFCSEDDFLQKLDEDNENNISLDNIPLEEWDKETGKQIQTAIAHLQEDENALAELFVQELVHLQDIFSKEDINHWDAASIANANANFEQYAGKGQILIGRPFGDYEFWESVLNDNEELQ